MTAAMLDGRIGFIDTPAQGNVRPEDVTWCADNGCFSDKWDQEKWWAFLVANAHHAASCLFAVAPDVVEDAAATLERSTPWLAPLRSLGYPVAYVAQNGFADTEIPWDAFDVLFIGGDDPFKLGPDGRTAVAEAKVRGKRVHMGRVNSAKRWRYAEAIGCDSVDGTILTFGPDINLRRVSSDGFAGPPNRASSNCSLHPHRRTHHDRHLHPPPRPAPLHQRRAAQGQRAGLHARQRLMGA